MKKRKGGILLEIVVVLVILGTLTAIYSPNVSEILFGGKHSAAKSETSALATNVMQYTFELNQYPASLNDLTVKVGNLGPWTTETALTDPWGNQYLYGYDADNGKVAVWSIGKNGANDSGNAAINGIINDDIGIVVTALTY